MARWSIVTWIELDAVVASSSDVARIVVFVAVAIVAIHKGLVAGDAAPIGAAVSGGRHGRGL